ncbi:demethylmenaquinone methyltransferase [Lactobacillus sp. CC-MHH1034]|uniref:demethylmenaquinone methyltransferase n=1 Tax=Agrilactobacillus fermenti TaxID=2586909 RepID=UPI001E41D89F|nr:demethylmenaquinone methyltransferase [Agrilactobacillus fermenti]MCD2256431.1 demethylmenaquinone methyltransferase [Agrilactobacillus fermenti]
MVLTNKTPATKVQAIFNNIAGNYDAMNNVISLGLHNHWRTVTNRALQLTAGDQILDVCCGTGVWSFGLAQYVGPSGLITGLDFSEAMLQIATEKKDAAGLTNVRFEQGDAQHLPFPDNHFDRVTIGFGLRNVPDADQVLREMFRVVKPGGIVACLETSKPQNKFVRMGWELYVGKLMPLLGGLVHHYKEYNYLQSSTHGFLSPQALAEKFWQAGFKQVHYQTFLFGTAAAHFGTK